MKVFEITEIAAHSLTARTDRWYIVCIDYVYAVRIEPASFQN